jgi:hypothetical protein
VAVAVVAPVVAAKVVTAAPTSPRCASASMTEHPSTRRSLSEPTACAAEPGAPLVCLHVCVFFFDVFFIGQRAELIGSALMGQRWLAEGLSLYIYFLCATGEVIV